MVTRINLLVIRIKSLAIKIPY